MKKTHEKELEQVLETVLTGVLGRKLEAFEKRLGEKFGVKTEPNQEGLITRKELAKELGVTQQTLIAWDKKGQITPLRFGSRVRYKLNDVLNRGPIL